MTEPAEFSDLTDRQLRDARIQARLDMSAACTHPYDGAAEREAKARLARLLAETQHRLAAHARTEFGD